ncbi:MAG TPA: hypothetical protein VFG73_00465 [Rhodanobacteraceae bacterium]|nr:hypothetical protein [Rhodanobacteraceae bacterium]
MSVTPRHPTAGEMRIEKIARKTRLGQEPSLVDEYARFSIDERLEMFLRLRHRVIKDRHGTDPGLERVHSIARRT